MTVPADVLTRPFQADGTILISGVQALVRLMLAQSQSDRRAGLLTGGFVSGYRGSPLGTLDATFAKAAALCEAANIRVKPAINEEMAATAIAGSQQIAQTNGARVDGVFSLWYGKGPGLDRASDAIRHGNLQGTSPLGGVVVAVGDDHTAKSSSIVCYSDEVVAGLQMPLLYPADAAEIISYGLHGFAMSRLSGSWTALKIITEVADATRVIDVGHAGITPVLPDIARPVGGLHNNWPETPLEQESRLVDYRLPAILAYVRANHLDQARLRHADSRIGLIAAGKSWLDLLEALRLLGLDDGRLERLGIALYKPALIWPLEPDSLREFAAGLETILVVEEKGSFVETQIRALCYDLAGAPRVWGKRDESGKVLLPATGDLTPERIARAIGRVFDLRFPDEGFAPSLEAIEDRMADSVGFSVAPTVRKPFFCSGCPHNRSTVVPEGSRALAGIGCHGLAAYNRARTGSFAQMGGEGIHWMGLSPFTEEAHVFANMGDGTYFHSGLLAIRQAVSAGINITYKLLFNSAVAMTGGQAIDGELTIADMVDQLRGEGVGSIVIVADDMSRYPAGDRIRAAVSGIVHRDDLDAVQRRMCEEPGVSAIIFDQMCATEKRRLRKRRQLPSAPQRVFINESVCENCGDCSAKSNCLSVEPVRTDLGTKRRINQSSCNVDLSCVQGFCPSFVTIEGVKPKRAAIEVPLADDDLPAPPVTKPGRQRVLVAGIGGTGVVTIGALLTMSAHLRGKGAAVLDQTGMAQKGGAVTSHLHLLDEAGPGAIDALRISAREADLVIVCDQVVGNARDVIASIDPGRTRVLANENVAITGDFTQNRSAIPDRGLLRGRLARRAGTDRFAAYPFTALSEALLGDAIGSNLMMVGFAHQMGWLALDRQALDEALAINGQAVAMNAAAFRWGRQLATDPASVRRAAGLIDEPERELPLDAFIADHAQALEAYQDQAYADRFIRVIGRVRAAEVENALGDGLTRIAARTLRKLMAYKDEYEVARLFTDGRFEAAIAAQFQGRPRLSFHMAPPLLSGRDPVTGELRKRTFGGWMMPVLRLLARFRFLRGTRLDPFGLMEERRIERALVVEYEALLDKIASDLTADRLPRAIEIAALPLEIRGYGSVKLASIERYRAKLAARLAEYDVPAEPTDIPDGLEISA